nr:MAG TPA: hypothetical protein [Caudoviricetes sp.]
MMNGCYTLSTDNTKLADGEACIKRYLNLF